MIKHGHGDGGDHGNLLVVILEDEHHVKVLKTELDTFKVDKLNVFQGRNKGRPRGEVDLGKQVFNLKGQCELLTHQAARSGLQKTGLAMWHSLNSRESYSSMLHDCQQMVAYIEAKVSEW